MVRKKIPAKIIKNVNQYLTVLRRDKLPIKEAILFGSFAKGKQKKWSDIDICIISPRFKNRSDAISYLWRKKHEMEKGNVSLNGHDLEPIGYNPKDFINEDPLVWEIKNYGIRIGKK